MINFVVTYYFKCQRHDLESFVTCDVKFFRFDVKFDFVTDIDFKKSIVRMPKTHFQTVLWFRDYVTVILTMVILTSFLSVIVNLEI